MKQDRLNRRTNHREAPLYAEQRTIGRTPVVFGLMYSGLDDTEVVMGDGTALNLSPGGLGIRGTRPVKAGMELTLFLYLPDKEEPLFIALAYVAWASGHQFGVHLDQTNPGERGRLDRFLHTFSRSSKSGGTA